MHNKIIFTKEQLNSILEMHYQGMNDSEIAAEMGVSKGTIGRRLREMGIVNRHTRVTKVQEQEIIDLYKNGYTIKKISSKIKRTEKTISEILNKNNIIKRSNSETHIVKKYNYDYFEEIDNPVKAYFLGLLAADGCVCKSNSNISISLQEQDKEILEKLRSELQYPHSLKLIKYSEKNVAWSDQYCLSISNCKMHSDLIKHGIIPNKSLYLEYPKMLKKEYDKYFILGFLDGNGHINKKERRVQIVSTEKFCKQLKQIIENELCIHCSVVKCKDRKACNLQIAGRNQVKKFLDWLYSDLKICLNRKYQTYKQIYDNSIHLI